MTFAILALAAAIRSVEPQAQARAQVSIRILNGARVTKADWEASKRKSDRLVRDKSGTQVHLRTIDFE
jgi:hypothetical protein